jgi:uncharacterized membrane protein
MITVTLYSKDGCHLCEDVIRDLEQLSVTYPHQLVVIDIDGNDELFKKYALDIPVVEVGPYTLKAPIKKEDLSVTLAAAINRKQQLESLQDPEYLDKVKRGAVWSKADEIALWIARHYMKILTLAVILYVGFPLLAPVFMKIGWKTPGEVIYKAYGLVCHQLAYRSFFLFGEQWVYPKQKAGLESLKSYQQITGLSEDNSAESILNARAFVGNEQTGYKIALCERDVAIYLGILAFCVMFILAKRQFPPLPWYVWVLVGLVPIGLDGVSQIISQPPFNLLPYRESTPILRVLTGSMFGFFTAWFGLPSVEESMAATRSILSAKKLRLVKTNKLSDEGNIDPSPA